MLPGDAIHHGGTTYARVSGIRPAALTDVNNIYIEFELTNSFFLRRHMIYQLLCYCLRLRSSGLPKRTGGF